MKLNTIRTTIVAGLLLYLSSNTFFAENIQIVVEKTGNKQRKDEVAQPEERQRDCSRGGVIIRNLKTASLPIIIFGILGCLFLIKNNQLKNSVKPPRSKLRGILILE